MTDHDPFNLARFVDAQGGIYTEALRELRAGRKRGHWMWFVFPQLAGLGRSSTARFYGIASLAEAKAYLAHPVLGDRLCESVAAVLSSLAPSLHALFGSPDDLKFKSSMTLFDAAQPDSHFSKALAHWCGGDRDLQTLAVLSQADG